MAFYNTYSPRISQESVNINTTGYLAENFSQGRNEVYGIRDQRPEKGRDQGSQPRDLKSQRVGSGSAVFFMESGIKFRRVQGSKLASSLGLGIKILGKNMGSVTKKYTSLRPCSIYWSSVLLAMQNAILSGAWSSSIVLFFSQETMYFLIIYWLFL